MPSERIIKMDFKKYLTDNVLDFWIKNSLDYENGGIFTQLDRDGSIYGTEKSVWFQGRALWVFSKAYDVIEKKEEYLSAATNIYKFLDKCTDSDGRMFFIVSKEGVPIQKRRYFFSETFAAIGCAQYYKITKNEKAWEDAKKYFDMACRVFYNNELTTPKFTNTNLKALSPIMIMLSTAQIMASVGIDSEKYKDAAKDMAQRIIKGGFFNTDLGALLENVSEDGSFCDTPAGRLVNPGHSLEAAWFLMYEGCLSGNKELIDAGKQIIDFTMPRGLDKKHGGIIAFTDVLGKPATALEWDMKLWWPQCEAIIANKMAYMLFGDEKYNDNYKMLCDYAFENFADKENNEWYGYLHYDNTPSTYIKGNIFKGPFHLPRMLMVLVELDSLGSIEKI